MSSRKRQRRSSISGAKSSAAVLELRLAQAAARIGATDFLESFVAGVGTEEFLRSHWRRRALATHADVTRLEPLFADLLWSADVDNMPAREEERTRRHHSAASQLSDTEVLSALLEASPSPSIAVWMPARAAAAAAAAATVVDDFSARGGTNGSTKCRVGACEEGGFGGEEAPRLNSIQVPDAKSALACYAAGNSLYFSAPDPFVLRYVRTAAAVHGP